MNKLYKNFKVAIVFIFSVFLVVNFTSCINKNYGNSQPSSVPNEYVETETYILNVKSKKIHKTSCGTARLIKKENREEYTGDIYNLFDIGYSKCKNCFRE